VEEKWHTLPFDFSGGITRAYIDGQLVTTAPELHQFDQLRLGVNNERGGRCLVDEVVIYAAEIGTPAENATQVDIPLMGWDQDYLWPSAKVGGRGEGR
jgi:hypothetical protein